MDRVASIFGFFNTAGGSSVTDFCGPLMARFRFLAAALLVFGTSVPGSWSWSMTVAFAPRAGPGPRTSMHALQPMRRQAGCRVASVGGRRAVGAVALQMAGSGAFLRVQQMQSRLKSLKVPCVICLPAAAPCAGGCCALSVSPTLACGACDMCACDVLA